MVVRYPICLKGGQDNMVSTITTLGTPHNGTPAADKLGSTKFIKDTINRIGKLVELKRSI